MKIENIRNDKENAKGITLVALIITIIIMLILAGVVVSLTLGENGLFKTAKNAARNYTDEAVSERNQIDEIRNFVSNELNSDKEENPYTQLKVGDYVNYPVYYDNISVQSSTDSSVSWTPKDEYNGWRILSIDQERNTVRLISAGIPLSYYHKDASEVSLYNLTINFFSTPIASSIYYDFDSCGFKTSQNGTKLTNMNDVKTLFTNEFTQNYGEGETYTSNGNTYTYTAGNPKVQSMTKSDADMIWGSEIPDGTNISGNDLLLNSCKNHPSLVVPVWTAKANGIGIYAISENACLIDNACFGIVGVRPVVTLKSNVKFTKASSNINNTQTWDIEI